VQTDIVTPEIKPAILPAVIFSRQTNDDVVIDENVDDDRPEAATTTT